MSLKIDYKNDVFVGNRKYQMIDNGDGTYSFVDVTTYSQNGDKFGALDINTTNGQINTHEAKTNNPHSVTKAQVGLESVENYGIASQAEAEAGTVNNKYMTPLRVLESIRENTPWEPIGRVELTADSSADIVFSNIDSKYSKLRLIGLYQTNGTYIDITHNNYNNAYYHKKITLGDIYSASDLSNQDAIRLNTNSEYDTTVAQYFEAEFYNPVGSEATGASYEVRYNQFDNGSPQKEITKISGYRYSGIGDGVISSLKIELATYNVFYTGSVFILEGIE